MPEQETPVTTRGDMFARWPTGAKLFLILSIALLPLALIATFATLRVTQIADTELRSHLRVAAAESTRAIAIELVGDTAPQLHLLLGNLQRLDRRVVAVQLELL